MKTKLVLRAFFFVLVLLMPAVASAERPPAPPAMSTVTTPQEALEWMVATDRRGRHIGGILGATVGFTIGTLGVLNFAGALDMGFEGEPESNAYFGAMTVLGFSTAASSLYLRARPNTLGEMMGADLLEFGGSDDEIRRYLENRAYSARRNRIGTGIATAGFAVAAFLAVEAVSGEFLGGESLRVSIIFGSATMADGLSSLILPTPEERLVRRLRGLTTAQAQVSMSPGGFRLVW
jgi:hypothetical protein